MVAPARERSGDRRLFSGVCVQGQGRRTKVHAVLEMIDSVLSVRNLEADEIDIELAGFKLEQLLDELNAHYTMSPDRPIRFLWDYPRDLPVIRTDREKLKQILQNLIHNAIKFTEKGKVAPDGSISWRSQGCRIQSFG